MFKLLAVVLLFVAVAWSQETLNEDTDLTDAGLQERKEKRGISLNLGQGLEGYSYLGPSTYGRGVNSYRGYTPMADVGYDGVNYGYGASNFASGYQGGYQGGYNQPSGSYPYRGGYPTSYASHRQYTTPVNTFPLGGIGTVGPYGGAYNGGGYNGGYNGGFNGGYNRLGNDGGYGSSGFGYQYQQQHPGYY